MTMMTLSLSATAGKIALEEVQLYESKRPTSQHKAALSAGGKPPVETSWEDVEKISQVGAGAFSNVYKAKVRHPKLLGDKTYALKCLKEQSAEEESSAAEQRSSSHKKIHFVAGAVDLALEAKILSELQHENIIRLVAVPTGCVAEAFAQKGGYFIVLELLEETLDDRLRRWGKSTSMLTTGTSPVAILERIESTVMGIAKAMAHLHQHKIILRDLKPDNVGFLSGTVKLFDFGLARPVDNVKDSGEFAGSLRYMAPEAVLARGISLASDVYSFGVLLWQICTLRQPFKKYTKVSHFKEKVVLGKYRPSVRGLSSLQLSKLIEKCWHFEPAARPTFAKILEELETIIGGLSSYKKLPSSLLKKGQTTHPSLRRAISTGSADLGSSSTTTTTTAHSSGKFGRMPRLKRHVSSHRRCLLSAPAGECQHCVVPGGHDNTIAEMHEFTTTQTEEASESECIPVLLQQGRPRSKSMVGTCSSCGKISSHTTTPGVLRPPSLHGRDCSSSRDGGEDSISEVSDSDRMSDTMDDMMSDTSCRSKSTASCDESFKSCSPSSRSTRSGIFGGFRTKFWKGSLSFHSTSSKSLKRIPAKEDEDEDASAIFDTPLPPLTSSSVEGITP